MNPKLLSKFEFFKTAATVAPHKDTFSLSFGQVFAKLEFMRQFLEISVHPRFLTMALFLPWSLRPVSPSTYFPFSLLRSSTNYSFLFLLIN